MQIRLMFHWLSLIWVVSFGALPVSARPTPDGRADQNAPSAPLDKVEDLKAVVVIFRHADRAPLYAFETNPQGPEIWPGGLRKLTAKGVQQEYQLGKLFRTRYGSLLDSSTPVADQVTIDSSGTSRTLACAQLFATALFPPECQHNWDDPQLGSTCRPVPIYSHDINDRDAIFGVSSCPLFQQMKNNSQEYPQFASVQKRFQNFTAFVQKQAGLHNFIFPRTFFDLSDIFYAQRQQGVPLPDWVTPSVEKDINFLADLWYVWMLGGVNRTAEYANKRIKLRGGNLLRTIMEVLTRKTNGSSLDRGTKIFGYSGHDENIGVTLSAFGLYPFLDKDTPGHINYASALVFELFNNDTVRIVFKNNRPEDPIGNPSVLVHPNCTEFCPLAKLVQLSSPYFMSEAEWFQKCRTPAVPQRPVEASKYDIEKSND